MTDTQNLILQNRAKLSVTGVTDVFGFDETSVSMSTVLGDFVLKGKDLHISRLSLETGEVDVEGTVDCLEYTKLRHKKESFLSRLFK